MIKNKNLQTTILILLAFVFSISVRMIWVYQFDTNEQFKFNNQFMINTNDGYFYAEGARDILANHHEKNDLSPVDTAMSELTAFIAKVLPFSFETIILYMPSFLASLLVIPIILIGKNLGRLEVGFIAAIFASIAWSYYNRTMVGYYDTDMLNIVFPTFFLWSLIWAIRTQKNIYILITALDIIAYRWWYPQSYSLEFAFAGMILIYIIYQYILMKKMNKTSNDYRSKKSEYRYDLTLLSFMIFAMSGLDGYIRVIIVSALFTILVVKKDIVLKYLYYIFAIAVLLFFITGGFDPIWYKLKYYVFKDSVTSVGEILKLNFFTVNQTVRESSAIPFEIFANRISGHTTIFIASIIGYILLAYKYRVMLLGLPMIALGFLAYSGGLRFTIYAVPILALGVGYLIYMLSSLLSNKIAKYLLMVGLTMIILIPNIIHIIGYRVPTVFTKQEVDVLAKLKNIASREDYVVGWWDYGYPIRYYSDVKTLIDGGAHKANSDIFNVSFILTSEQTQSANMSRLATEYTEKKYNGDINRTIIAQMILDYGYNDSNDFLTSLQTDIKLPSKTRDIYFYLPNRMLNIYPTIRLFSNIDLMNGIKGDYPFFYKTRNFRDNGSSINFGNGISLDKKTGKLNIGQSSVTINRYVTTTYTNDNKLKTNMTVIDSSSNYNIIYMQSYEQFLIVDEQTYNSLYFRLFVLEDYDKSLFEPTILTPLAKVYKLKR